MSLPQRIRDHPGAAGILDLRVRGANLSEQIGEQQQHRVRATSDKLRWADDRDVRARHSQALLCRRSIGYRSQQPTVDVSPAQQSHRARRGTISEYQAAGPPFVTEPGAKCRAARLCLMLKPT